MRTYRIVSESDLWESPWVLGDVRPYISDHVRGFKHCGGATVYLADTLDNRSVPGTGNIGLSRTIQTDDQVMGKTSSRGLA